MAHFDDVAKAYKKLKAAVFFDKTQLTLRNKLVLFENENVDEKLQELANAHMSGEGWGSRFHRRSDFSKGARGCRWRHRNI